jgi:hypothetical protein
MPALTIPFIYFPFRPWFAKIAMDVIESSGNTANQAYPTCGPQSLRK